MLFGDVGIYRAHISINRVSSHERGDNAIVWRLPLRNTASNCFECDVKKERFKFIPSSIVKTTAARPHGARSNYGTGAGIERPDKIKVLKAHHVDDSP